MDAGDVIMRIALSGAQGTGKTTLINELKRGSFLPHYTFYDEVVRNLVKRTGISINRKADDYSQTAITNEQVRLASETTFNTPNAFFDRCIVDSHAFTIFDYVREQISKKVYMYSSEMLKMVFTYFPYDMVIYIPPKIQLVEDGVRDTDVQYRNRIDKLMTNVLNYNSIKSASTKIYTLTEISVQDRIKEILNNMEEVNEIKSS
jgi:nicotinamide riboside kinase